MQQHKVIICWSSGISPKSDDSDKIFDHAVAECHLLLKVSVDIDFYHAYPSWSRLDGVIDVGSELRGYFCFDFFVK